MGGCSLKHLQARRGPFSEADLETAYAMYLIGFVDVNIWLIVGFLFVVGSSLAPAQTPSPQERIWSAVTLTSLSACSVTGAGFCRFDYQRRQQLVSVETVPPIQVSRRLDGWNAVGDQGFSFCSHQSSSRHQSVRWWG